MINPARSFLSNNKATYITVAEYIGVKTNDRDKAKKACRDFANERNLNVSDLFDDYNEMLIIGVRQMALEGYFDY